MEPTVIARHSFRKAMPPMILFGVCMVVGFWVALGLTPGSRYRETMLIMAPVALLMILVFFYKFIAHRRRAVWIANGKLDLGWGEAAPLKDILDVVIGRDDLLKIERAILVKLRDGEEMTIDTRHLTESPSVVLARLRDALGLPEAV